MGHGGARCTGCGQSRMKGTSLRRNIGMRRSAQPAECARDSVPPQGSAARNQHNVLRAHPRLLWKPGIGKLPDEAEAAARVHSASFCAHPRHLIRRSRGHFRRTPRLDQASVHLPSPSAWPRLRACAGTLARAGVFGRMSDPSASFLRSLPPELSASTLGGRALGWRCGEPPTTRTRSTGHANRRRPFGMEP